MALTKRLQWPDGKYTAWRDATDERVIHASAPGLKGKARCDAEVAIPLAVPSIKTPDVGVVLPFSYAATSVPVYIGDPAPRVICEECVRISVIEGVRESRE